MAGVHPTAHGIIVLASLALWPFSGAAAALFEDFESWPDPDFGDVWESQSGAGGEWATLGCRITSAGARSGSRAIEIKGGPVGSGAEPMLVTGMKTGDIGEVSFWYRAGVARPSIFNVAYRTVKDGPLQQFPNGAGMLVAGTTNWFKWKYNFTGPEWRTNGLQLQISRNAPDSGALVIDDFRIGPHGECMAPDRGAIAAAVPAGLPVPPAPFITTNIAPPLPTGDWWSSILAVRGSGLLSAKPLMFFTKPASLEMAYPRRFVDTNFVPAGAVRAPFDVSGGADVSITATGGAFPGQTNGSARVDGWGDFSVRVRIGNDQSHITAHLVHGSPYAFVEFTACESLLKFPRGFNVELTDKNVSALVVAVVRDGLTNHYALFGPAGTVWETGTDSIVPRRSDGVRWLSVAVLPSRGPAYDPAEYELIRAHAFALPVDTVVDLSYDQARAAVSARYRVQTRTLQGREGTPLLGLLPLHWKNSPVGTAPGLSYETLLGDLRLCPGNEFTANFRFRGIVPQFPAPGQPGWDAGRFSDLAREVPPVVMGGDLYSLGKGAQKLARLIPALDSTGDAQVKSNLLAGLRKGLADMFSYEEGDASRFFGYHRTWGTLLGYPEAFGSAWGLNDHHFQHGLLVYAAAILGLYDPDFVQRYGDVVDWVVRDYNNPSRIPSGSYPMPWLRHFDPWEGHSWASGLGGGKAFCPDCGDNPANPGSFSLASFAGPDQESTSECMNSWAAMVLWGEVRGNREFRDMGIIGYTLEAEAIREYVYDVDGSNRPPEFAPTMVSRIFGDALDTATHFSAELQHAWGIQYLPTGPHMTYQGYFPEYRRRDYDFLRRHLAGEISGGWRDIHLMYRGFFEPERALADYTADTPVDFGNTEANLYYWLHAMNSLGRVNEQVCSDFPSLVVLSRDGTATCVAYNYSDEPRTARVFRCANGLTVGNIAITNKGLSVFRISRSPNQEMP